jgi:RNA polymerase sigma-70 factor, ECF subfamily
VAQPVPAEHRWMTTRHEDDPELRRAIAELQAGTRVETQSRRVFELYYPWVRRFFARLGYAPQDSEDLAQETFRRVFDQIGSFRNDGSFKSWLFAVASNIHRNEARRRHREKRDAPEVSLDTPAEEGGLLREPPASEASPARATYEKERREALARAIRELPPQMRQVLALRIDQDLKYREIAAVLQISIETVKAHLFQARQRLRTELGEDYGLWDE